ncbi:trypsin-1-like isoform X2 [Bolinopsis microptera]|uniref:trypsin-1-like isoform X2 n=1 Tax=Bolinopsis microptera TaxID=2820187 RepID=UPI0030795655
MYWLVLWTFLGGVVSGSERGYSPRGYSPRGIQPRIYNGDDAVIGEFPFMAQVLADIAFNEEGVMTQNLCGGSILATNIILTAAHCVVRDVSGLGWEESQDQIYHPVQLGVWTGDLDNFDTDNQQFGSVKAIIVHEDYDSYRVVNDIAVIVLENDLLFDKYTAAVSLPKEEDMLYTEGSLVTVVGWGLTEEEHTSHVLQKLNYEVRSREQCTGSYGDQFVPGMMCTGIKPMEKHSAIGDSGGPLITKVKDKWVQLGIVSWGAEDPDESSFDVNTDVSYFKSWIQSVLNKVNTKQGQKYISEDESKNLLLTNLPNYTFKRITFYPKDRYSKYTRIRIKDSYLNANSFITIYDGSPLDYNQMLAQWTGNISLETVVGFENQELTVIIMTGKESRDNHINLTFNQVRNPGTRYKLRCSLGYSRCLDNFYCIQNKSFCDGVGQCKLFVSRKN